MKITSLLLGLVPTVVGLPQPQNTGSPVSSYNVTSAMEVANALAEGRLAHLFGNENARELFESSARMFGAGPGTAGNMSQTLKEIMNRKDFVILRLY
jgi:hypothetical protein